MTAKTSAARAIALVGPSSSGKTTLMEALLFASGALERQGTTAAGTTVGDASPEARTRQRSVELNLANFTFMDDRYGVIDCPGAVEFAAEADLALSAVDLALVVIDSDPHKAALVQPILTELDRLKIPRAIFVNKVDQARGEVRDLLSALQPHSRLPLVARQLPIWSGEHITGFVDLALERAFVYRQGQPSEQVDIPADLVAEEGDARFHMLEQLADHDDELMEQLLSDIMPSRETVFGDLVKEEREGLIAPVFFGSGLNGFGVRRLLKALRHDTPEPALAAERLGCQGDCAYLFKTSHAGAGGKLAFARVLSGKIADGAEVTCSSGEKTRVSGVFQVQGAATKKVAAGATGELVALGKVEAAHAGELLSLDGRARQPRSAPADRRPVFSMAIAATNRNDDVRLSGALAKLLEEDPALRLEHTEDTHEVLLRGQGEEHLKAALDRLQRRFGVAVASHRPRVAYNESIKKPVTQHGRHKKQSGGHGQFGDVHVEIRPQPRGEGFAFSDKIVGGVVPRQWIPAVEQGVRDATERGPLGYPVVDVQAVLIDGSYHAVDSSELAFRTAGRIAMSEGLRACQPYLLEPIEKLTIYAPSSATSKITSVISSRRGQILGFNPREGWPGWDAIEVYLPQSERGDLITELRSLTQGMATFDAEFDHMAELSGRLAEEAVKAAGAHAA